MFSLPAAIVAMAIAGNDPGQTVLLDFYADWCGPCRSMMPTVDRLAAQGYPVQRMNIDQHHDLAQRFGITSIPCFVMIVNGREVSRVVGPTSLGRLEQLCSYGRQAATPSAMVAQAPAPPARFSEPGSGTDVCAVPSLPPGYAPPATTAIPASIQVPVAQRTQGQAIVSDAALLAASVRLRVVDPQGQSCGSGTIIDALPGGEALVLTCGHLFRDSNGQGKVEVDVFGTAPTPSVPGRVIAFDLERDVALVAFRPQGAVTVARVAPRNYVLRAGDAVTSVGCDYGRDPTVQHSQINALDRFQDAVEARIGHKIAEPHAPWNVEVAGQPVEGRSGGGLFSADGLVIGVCNAREPTNREGMFAALGSIQAALDQQKLTSLYEQAPAPPMLVQALNPARPATPAVDPFAAHTQVISTSTAAAPSPFAASAPVATMTAPPQAAGMASLGRSEQATLDEIHHKLREGLEVVCIIRDRNDPNSHSDVITLDRASPVFVNQLSRAAERPVVKQETSLEVTRPRTPILEWDSEAGWIHGPLPR